MEKEKVLIWLDDCRDPFKHNNKWLIFSPIEQPFKTVWVKSYQEFKDYIIDNRLPDAICFDHDLGTDYSLGITINNPNEKTGYDCAKWLVEYCIEHRLKLPLYNIQSANPVGKENIDKFLKNFIKYYKYV